MTSTGAPDMQKNFQEMMRGQTPKDVRLQFRKGKYFMAATSGICSGYKQANLMAVHKDVAADLREYCRLNYGPMACIFSSEPGQFDVPQLSQDSDVRTDLGALNVFVNGEFAETVPDLLKFGEQLNDFCFFYFGCSFSFDEALLAGGVPLRNLEQKNTNVSMYKSNVQCHGYGCFYGNQVVSMKPIPKELVEKSYQITHPLGDVHGAPMHIGDPAVIGIDVEKVDYGIATRFHEGDVAVFWPCGVTGLETVKAAKLPLAFTHRPGSMLLTDSPCTKPNPNPPPEDLPRVVWLADTPPLGSTLSQATMDRIKKLETAAIEDIGKRQIGHLLVEDDLLKAALSLSHAKSVAVTTGFPVKLEGDNLFETDGPPGAIAMATMLQVLGKDVVLVIDDVGGLLGWMIKLVDMLVERGVLSKTIPIECYPPTGQSASKENAVSFLTSQDGQTPRFDHLVAIERAGVGQDGLYHSASGRVNNAKVGGIDALFNAARDVGHVFTTGIGDGGNEIGMGKVKERVVSHIPKGDIIATVTSTDYLICAGVSNWGGYAIATALALLRLCPIHDRYRRRAIGLPPTEEEIQSIKDALPTVDKEEKVLEAMVELGFMDATGEVKMAVDWLPFHDVHANKIKEISSVCS
ncbi:D-glutamate cyclase, mitochondrial-like isoform X1 [Lytechinus pictus]|uniref:D-glutamate cyclase, mitochondrial-like isoform X1 n=2 Tax=Lytechinus pictus TaxID=7653 RepID=UPI0030B9F908